MHAKVQTSKKHKSQSRSGNESKAHSVITTELEYETSSEDYPQYLRGRILIDDVSEKVRNVSQSSDVKQENEYVNESKQESSQKSVQQRKAEIDSETSSGERSDLLTEAKLKSVKSKQATYIEEDTCKAERVKHKEMKSDKEKQRLNNPKKDVLKNYLACT